MNCIKMPINEFVNLRELFQKHNPEELKKLETLTKSVLFSFSAITKKASIKLIREKYAMYQKNIQEFIKKCR